MKVAVRRGTASIRFDARVAAVTAALAAATVAAVLVSVAVGEYAVSPLDAFSDSATRFIVLELRLPRAVTGLLAGAALGLAGAIFQDVTRNPLVSPDIVGVAGGASVVGAWLFVIGAPEAVPLGALAGALTAGAILYALAWRRGVQGFRIVLVGIGVAAFAQAGVGFVLTHGRIFEVGQAYVWLVGSLNGRGWEQAWPLAAGLAILGPLTLAAARGIGVLGLGDEVARGLGLDVERARLALLAAAVVLTGLAVAATGPIGFVAFLAPHLARRLVNANTLAAAAVTGALLVLLADLAGRMLFAPTEIPVGILTSILAAPYFLWKLRSR